MVLCRFGHQSGGEVKEGQDEFVGVLRFYVELLKRLGGKSIRFQVTMMPALP